MLVGIIPAPVLPVIAFECISPFIMFELIEGNKANCSAVAKHPGFAMFFEDLISFFCNSGNP